MKLFGHTDRDLPLLRLPLIELEAAIEANTSDPVYDQIRHHCIRLAWKESARCGAPVRDLLQVIAGNAYLRLMKAIPNEEPEYDEELLHALIEETERMHECRICFGFLLHRECRGLLQAALLGSFPQKQSIFAGNPHLLYDYYAAGGPYSQFRVAQAAVLKLQQLWDDYRRNVATDPLVRETVRIVAAETGLDPRLSSDFDFIGWRLHLLNRWISESEAGQPLTF